VFLLGHSYGGFVAQGYALDHPERLAGLILYESASVTGDEYIAEATIQLQRFAARNAEHPQLPAVLHALQKVSSCTDDAELNEALHGLLPAYFADYWAREEEFAAFRETCTVTYISGLDAELNPDVIDDRDALSTLPVPTLVLVGRRDVICGVRWARELHELIPHSRLITLEDSGHLGHVEQPEEFVNAVTTFTKSVTWR
jgi:pimeloyl-ACP methyl ester carboxylesterase